MSPRVESEVKWASKSKILWWNMDLLIVHSFFRSGQEVWRGIIYIFKQHCCLHLIIENNVGAVSIDLSMNPSPEQQRECPQHHSHSRPQYLCLPSSTRKSTYRTSTDIESFINVWTLCKMMPYVSSFVSNFIDSKLCLGFTHDVVYCSTLFFSLL